MAKKTIPSIHVPIQTENGSMELAWYLYLKSTGEGGGGSTTVDWDDITNKPNFATVATSGSYNDLSNKPTIPIVNNSTITFTQGGVTKGTITLNQSSSETIAFESGGGTDLPDQTGHSGDFLTTNGASVSWGAAPVTSVNSKTGAVTLTASDVGALPDSTVIPAAQVNSDWNASSGVAQILNKPTLGTMAAESANDYTKTSGLAAVATSGSYSDLNNKPTIPAAQVNSDWNANSGVAEILNKPTIPTVNDATITFTQGGVTKGTITTNQSSASTIALDAGGGATVPQSIDAEIVGTLTITDNSVVTGFPDNSGNYLEVPGYFDMTGASSFEIGTGFEIYTAGNQTIFGQTNSPIQIRLSNGVIRVKYDDGTSTQTVDGTTVLQGQTRYYVRFKYDGTNYTVELSTDGVNYTQEKSEVAQRIPHKNTQAYRIGSTSTTITKAYMEDWYIKKNGITVWQGMDAPGLHQRVAKGHEVIAFQMPTANNNYTWYRKYRDGWVEQGGYVAARQGSVVLPVTMADTYYMISHMLRLSGTVPTAAQICPYVKNITTTGFDFYNNPAGTTTWKAEGMAQ